MHLNLPHTVSWAVLLATLLVAIEADAQESAGGVESGVGITLADAGNRVIYSPEYFTAYNVVTARDQLERIPGLQELFENENGGGGNDEQRGFGNSGDQILINGKRLSGKSNDIGSAMDRIQARQVVRIEVIRGTVAGLDVRSQGRVVNVVLDGTLVTGVGSWQATVDKYVDDAYGGSGEVSYNGDIGALNYLLSVETQTRKDIEERTDLFFTPALTLFERQLENSRENTREHALTANTSYTFTNGNILNLNGRYAHEDEAANETSDRFRVVGSQQNFVNNLFIRDSSLSREWELGGDYEHTLANGNVFTTLFVYTSSSGDEDSAFSVTPAGGRTLLRELQVESSQASEKIVRGTYQWGVTETRSIQSGIEVALNEVSQRVNLQEDNNGVLEPVALFNPDSTVKEERLEAFTTYTWQPRSTLLLEGSLDLEFSELAQQGSDVSRSRNFFFARPRLVARFDQTPSIQWRGRIERRVDQLDFADFVASFSDDDNRIGVISAGNPELVPEQAWEYELAWERRLPDDLGVVSITGLYSDIRDSISSVPLLVRNENGVDEIRTATGNIDKAKAFEISLSGSMRLTALGLRTAVIEGSVTLLDTTITDPFTGEKSAINYRDDYTWSLGFRHDTSWRNLSYGMTAYQDGPSTEYDIDYTEERQKDTELELFVEMQLIKNLTMQLTVEETLRAESERQRRQFDTYRSTGVLERLESRTSRQGREVGLSVRGVF